MPPTRSGPTVYVVEPHANVVFADARLGDEPVAWALDADAERPTQDRQQLLALSSSGTMSAVETGQHAFGWRFPGVILGALTAALLYLLARVLFRRREVGIAVALLVLIDGMMFAQSRIAMNDVYTGVFIVAAYLIFALVWLGSWRGWSALFVAMPLIGVCLGLALAAKWVGLYAMGGIVLLILLRSAVGRVLALSGMVVLTGLLGWLAVSSPSSSSTDAVGLLLTTVLVGLVAAIGLRLAHASTTVIVAGASFMAASAAVLLLMPGNSVFLAIMIGLTVLLAVVMVVRPIRCSLDEARFAIAAPAALGILGTLAAILGGSRLPTEGALTATSLLALSLGLVVTSVLVYAAFALGGARGYGPLAGPSSADGGARPAPAVDPAGHAIEAPSPPPDGWLRPGWRLGLPWLWVLACVAVIPIVVYVVSYWPWVELGNLWFAGFPADHTGPNADTFLALQQRMYDYHNNLRATHAASSPWWAWPFDFKPVWFYLGNLAEGWTALIYDAGNLVLFWLSVPAMAWTAAMAWRRRSLALALILIGFACQWLPWARIDRATFQYHYYTSLPFVILALAYFLAELWHGPSSRTWLVARLAAAATLVAVPLLWFLRVPLVRHLGRGPGQPRLAGLWLCQRGLRAHRAHGGLPGHHPGRHPGAALAGSNAGPPSPAVGDRGRSRGSVAGRLAVAAGDGGHDRCRGRHRPDPIPRDAAHHGADRRSRPVPGRHPARHPAGRSGLDRARRPRSPALRHRGLRCDGHLVRRLPARHRRAAGADRHRTAVPDTAPLDLQLRLPIRGQHRQRDDDERGEPRVAGPDGDGRLHRGRRHVRRAYLAPGRA